MFSWASKTHPFAFDHQRGWFVSEEAAADLAERKRRRGACSVGKMMGGGGDIWMGSKRRRIWVLCFSLGFASLPVLFEVLTCVNHVCGMGLNGFVGVAYGFCSCSFLGFDFGLPENLENTKCYSDSSFRKVLAIINKILVFFVVDFLGGRCTNSSSSHEADPLLCWEVKRGWKQKLPRQNVKPQKLLLIKGSVDPPAKPTKSHFCWQKGRVLWWVIHVFFHRWLRFGASL